MFVFNILVQMALDWFIYILVLRFIQKRKGTFLTYTFKIYKVIFICSRHPNTQWDEPKHSCHTHLHLSTDDMLYSLMCSHSVPLFFSLTAEQKGQLEKESGLQILEAGLSDVSPRKGVFFLSPLPPSPMMTFSFPRVQPFIECILLKFCPLTWHCFIDGVYIEL